MALTAHVGKGTTVTVDGTPVTNVISVNCPEVSPDVEELAFIGDTEDYPHKVPTKVNYGDIKLTVAYDSTLHAALDALAESLQSPGATFPVVINTDSFDCVAAAAGEVTHEKSGILQREYTFVVQGPTPAT